MGSNPGNNKRKQLAIALPISLSLIFVIAIIAIVLIVRLKARSKRLVPGASVEVRAGDHEDGDADPADGPAQYEAREHGKDQAERVSL